MRSATFLEIPASCISLCILDMRVDLAFPDSGGIVSTEVETIGPGVGAVVLLGLPLETASCRTMVVPTTSELSTLSDSVDD
jgi:hypothetical protein